MVRKTDIYIVRRVMGAIASIILLLSLTMCQTDFCNENMYVVGTLKTFHKRSKSQMDVYLAPADQNDEQFKFIKRTNGGFANFVLNPKSDTSKFYIMTGDTFMLSKIAIVHTNRVEFVNAECGMRTMSFIDTVLIENAAAGDSVAIKLKDVDDKYDNENLEIYLSSFE